MRKILIVFTILFLIVWFYSSRKEQFTAEDPIQKKIVIKFTADDQSQNFTQNVTIYAKSNIINLKEVYDNIGILPFEYDWTQTKDDFNPNFENDSIFKSFEDISVDTNKTFFFKKQYNRTIISKELIILINKILTNRVLKNDELAKVVKINEIKDNLDLESCVNLLQPVDKITIVNQEPNIDKKIANLITIYKIIFKIATLDSKTKEDYILKIVNNANSSDSSGTIDYLQNLIKNSDNHLNIINFNINFPENKIELPHSNNLLDEDINYLNEVINIILSKYKLVNLSKKINNTDSVFYVNNRKRNVVMSYILNTRNLDLLPYNPNRKNTKFFTANILTTKSPTLGLSDIDDENSIPIFTPSPQTTQTPKNTNASEIVVNQDSVDFIRNTINTLRILHENYYTIFQNIPIDVILYPQLFVLDDIQNENNIFKDMISKTLEEYNQRYVYVSPNTFKEKLPELIDRNKVFKIPEVKKQIEYKSIFKLNDQAKEEQLKKRLYRKFDVKKIPINFSKAILDIMSDLINLYSAKEQFTNDEKNEIKNIWEKWKYYSTNTFMILTDNGRMFYVGVFLFVISILVYFSDLF